MIIDIHAHSAYYRLYPNIFLSAIADSIILSEPNNIDISKVAHRMIQGSLKDEKANMLLTQMKDANIDYSILLIVDLGYNRDDIELGIEEIYEHYYYLKNSSKRFIVFAGIDPRRGEYGYHLFRKGIDKYSFSGLKLYPPCGFSPDDYKLFDYYDICEEKQLPVLIHTGIVQEPFSYSPNYPDSIKKIAARYKSVPFILAHAAIIDYKIGIELAMKYDNIFLDISSFQSMIKKYADLEYIFRLLAKRIPDKILFGTDWPLFSILGNQKDWVNIVSNLCSFDSTFRDNVLSNNAKSILGSAIK